MTSPSRTAVQVLQQVPGFEGVDSAVLARIAEHGRPLFLQPGESLSRRGQPQVHLSVVCTGSVELCIFGGDGRRHVLRHLRPGDLFGLIPVLDGGGAIHDADAHEPTELLQIPRDALLAELMAQPQLALRLMQILCVRSRQLYELFAYQQLLPLRARIAHLLLCVYQMEPQLAPQKPAEFDIHMTQAEMSDMLGVSRQTLSTELKKFERQGIVRLAHARCAVVDMPALERAASTTD